MPLSRLDVTANSWLIVQCSCFELAFLKSDFSRRAKWTCFGPSSHGILVTYGIQFFSFFSLVSPPMKFVVAMVASCCGKYSRDNHWRVHQKVLGYIQQPGLCCKMSISYYRPKILYTDMGRYLESLACLTSIVHHHKLSIVSLGKWSFTESVNVTRLKKIIIKTFSQARVDVVSSWHQNVNNRTLSLA